MTAEANNLYEFADFRFDGRTHRLRRNDDIILLSPKASELLCLLLERPGEFVPKEEIFERVWTDTFVEDGVLTQNIYTLRKILGTDENGQPLIENRTRLGYRITVPVRALARSGDFAPEDRNGEQIIFAAQTRTEITEEIVEEDAVRTLPSAGVRNWKKIGIAIAACALLISAVAFFAYRFFRPGVENSYENTRFQRITDTGDIPFPAALSPDGNFVAYKWAGAVYVKDLATSAAAKLEIPNPESSGFMQFSPNSDFIYMRNRVSYLLPSNIVKVSRNGGEPVTVAENVWSAFSVSPDGKYLAFMRRAPDENRQGTILKNLENGEEREVFTVRQPEQFASHTYPAWSPDGKKILSIVIVGGEEFAKLVVTELDIGKSEDLPVEKLQTPVNQFVWMPNSDTLIGVVRSGKSNQIWELNSEAKKIRRITNDLNNYFSLMISADGTKLLTMQRITFTNIWTMNEDGRGQKQLTFGTSATSGYFGIDFCANGEIVYASNEGKGQEVNLWRMDPSDGARRQLTSDSGNNRNPSVSPDDKFIYFSSNRGGISHIWRIDANGENPTQITFSEKGNEVYPEVSPDGQYLYYISRLKQSSVVWRKSLTDGTEIRLTDESRLSPAGFLAASPDGKYLAFHHLSGDLDSEDITQTFQVAVIEIANPRNVRFFSTQGAKADVYWTSNSKAFDFVYSGAKASIARHSLEGNAEPQVLLTFPREFLVTLAHSKKDNTIALARGLRQLDAVLLTNFK